MCIIESQPMHALFLQRCDLKRKSLCDSEATTRAHVHMLTDLLLYSMVMYLKVRIYVRPYTSDYEAVSSIVIILHLNISTQRL